MRLRLTMLYGLMLFSILGCEERIPKKDLGTVIFEVPAVPGSDRPPELKDLEETPDSHPASSAKTP